MTTTVDFTHDSHGSWKSCNIYPLKLRWLKINYLPDRKHQGLDSNYFQTRKDRKT